MLIFLPFWVIKTIGRWILESLGVYNSYSGITTNQAEGFNTMLKQYQHLIEAPVDAIVPGLYHLQIYYSNKIQRIKWPRHLFIKA